MLNSNKVEYLYIDLRKYGAEPTNYGLHSCWFPVYLLHQDIYAEAYTYFNKEERRIVGSAFFPDNHDLFNWYDPEAWEEYEE